MGTLSRGLLAFATLAVMSLPAAAQTPVTQHGYVVGFGGMGATEVTSPYFGGSVGFNVTPDLQIFAEAGRSQDVLANFTEEDLAIVDASMTAEFGLPFQTSIKMPTNLVLGGLRYQFPVRGYARPYVSGAAGIARMRPKATFTLGNALDLTSEMFEEPVVQTVFRKETRPMASVGAGVAFVLPHHVTFDLGYAYSGIFIERNYLQDYEVSPHSHNRIDTHRIYAGAGFTF
jgi:opacity protein-like surface antigen